MKTLTKIIAIFFLASALVCNVLAVQYVGKTGGQWTCYLSYESDDWIPLYEGVRYQSGEVWYRFDCTNGPINIALRVEARNNENEVYQEIIPPTELTLQQSVSAKFQAGQQFRISAQYRNNENGGGLIRICEELQKNELRPNEPSNNMNVDA